jgi:hypothetical protein
MMFVFARSSSPSACIRAAFTNCSFMFSLSFFWLER